MYVLSSRGCVVDKRALSEETLDCIREELTVRPRVSPQYDFGGVQAWPVFQETSESIVIPRHYARTKLGPPAREDFPELPKRPRMQSVVTLRAEQVPIVDKAMSVLRSQGGGLLNLKTGAGKTILALEVCSRLGLRTMVVVHKSFLLNQWIDRIRDVMPDARIGALQGPKIDTDGKDIVVAMLQSLSQRDYPPGTLEGFGTLVVDECHHIGAQIFSRALPRVVTRYTLGLSATITRKDGLSKVFKHHLGDVIWKSSMDSPSTVVKQILYHSMDGQYCNERRTFRGTVMLPLMINNIVAHEPRNVLILHEVRQYVQEPERVVMVISERIAHLQSLCDRFESEAIDVTRNGVTRRATCGLYIGKMKQIALDDSAKKDVIFASTSMTREGLDIPALNTLVLASPLGDVVQASGRIMRRATDTPPLIVDIADTFSVFQGQTRKRKAFYDRSKFKVYSTCFQDGEELDGLNTTTDSMALSDEEKPPPDECTHPVPSGFLSDSDD
jgi:superfamily II DNA or RNA helicase